MEGKVALQRLLGIVQVIQSTTGRRVELPGSGVHLQGRLGKMSGAKYIRRHTFQGTEVVGQALGGAGMTQGAYPMRQGSLSSVWTDELSSWPGYSYLQGIQRNGNCFHSTTQC